MKDFSGKILFLDRDDINTDEIIPARYLTELAKEDLKPYLLEDLKIDNFDPAADIAGKSVIVTRANFGCGSSREHAPWALEVNGINLVIAESFARIFRQNMYNCGMMAIELPREAIDRLFALPAGEAGIQVDMEHSQIVIRWAGEEERIFFELNSFERELVRSGGWVEFADARY